MADNSARPKKGSDAEILKKMRERFRHASDAEAHNRETFQEDLEFSCTDDQWPQDVKQLRGEGRPMLTINLCNGVVKQIEGDYRQNKLSIHVAPSSGDASEETSEILAGLIRQIEQMSDADTVYLNCLRYASRGGFAWMRVMPEYAVADTFSQDLFIRFIANPLTVYCDPKARLTTRADARYMFVSELIEKDVFKDEYPDAKLDYVDGLDALDESYETWVDGEQIRVVEYFTKEKVPAKLCSFDNGAVIEIDDEREIDALRQIGWNIESERQTTRTQIKWRKCTAGQILEEKTYKMQYIPLIPVLGEEINVRGQVRLRSAIFYGKDANRMVNYWKSAATESTCLMPKAPALLTAEQIENHEDQWKNVNNKPQPYLLYNHRPDQSPPQLLQPPQSPIGEMSMAGGAQRDLQYTTNTFDANLGQTGQEVSGVAISERQHQGTTGNFLFTDNTKKGIEHCGRVLIDFIPLIYDTERVVRTIGLEGDSQTTIINKEIRNPFLGITEVLNDITIGKYQVTVEAGQAFATRRAEAVEGLLKWAQSFPQQAPLVADQILENMDVPGGEVMAERIRRSLPPQVINDPDSPEGQQAQAQAQQQQQAAAAQQQQMIDSKIQVEQGKNQASMAKSQADVIKSQAEVTKAKADTIQAIAQTHNTQAEHAAEVLDNSRTNNAGAVEAAPQTQAPAPLTPSTPMGTRQDDIAMAQRKDAENKHMLTALAGHMVAKHQNDMQQTQVLHQLLGTIAQSHQDMAQHMAHQNMIASAPIEAVRDKAGKIIGSRRQLNAG